MPIRTDSAFVGSSREVAGFECRDDRDRLPARTYFTFTSAVRDARAIARSVPVRPKRLFR
jgi:hypothetical protein